jgi:hypothetical protein
LFCEPSCHRQNAPRVSLRTGTDTDKQLFTSSSIWWSYSADAKLCAPLPGEDVARSMRVMHNEHFEKMQQVRQASPRKNFHTVPHEIKDDVGP